MFKKILNKITEAFLYGPRTDPGGFILALFFIGLFILDEYYKLALALSLILIFYKWYINILLLIVVALANFMKWIFYLKKK